MRLLRMRGRSARHVVPRRGPSIMLRLVDSRSWNSRLAAGNTASGAPGFSQQTHLVVAAVFPSDAYLPVEGFTYDNPAHQFVDLLSCTALAALWHSMSQYRDLMMTVHKAQPQWLIECDSRPGPVI